MKISFTTLGCPDWDLDTIIARAAEYGYDGVDFRGIGDEMEIYKLPAFSDQAAATLEKVKAAGLEISGFSSDAYMFCQEPEDRQASMEQLTRYAEMAKAMGAGFIRIFGGYLKETSRDEAIKISVDVMEQIAAVASPVCVAVETHDDWIATAPLAKVFEQVTASNVGVLWDLHHPFRMNGESPQESYDNIGKYTRYAHVKDSLPTEDGNGESALAGEGDVPLAEMIGLLKAGGYEGWLALEWEKKWQPDIAEPEVAFPSYAKFLRGILQA